VHEQLPHLGLHRIGGPADLGPWQQTPLARIDDIGSGALIDFSRFGFSGEPVARDSIATGADLVLFSGDKLLGGPRRDSSPAKKQWIQVIEKDR